MEKSSENMMEPSVIRSDKENESELDDDPHALWSQKMYRITLSRLDEKVI